MALTPGTRLGPYEVTAQIGVGGMGEVYRATDTNLKRAVAIKVLPEALAADAERLARFQREAEVLAALNHPNIAHIHGLERAGAMSALVMELVEGPTLADRIAQGPIPLDEALPIARQVAEALEAAHEQGIIHRDLKPANLKVREDGVVKVLDFGLAKLTGGAGGAGGAGKAGEGAAFTQSPTLTSPALMTGVGVILGTAAYMSPEQAKGRDADKRCDIWAFGCVLYEMLSGTRAFAGDDVSDTIASVLRSEPNWDALPPETTPTAARLLLQRCLERDLRRRIADVSVIRFVLNEPTLASAPAEASVRPVARHAVWRRVAPALAAAIAGGAATGAAVWMLNGAPGMPAAVTRFSHPLEESSAFNSVGLPMTAISPDGSMLVYAVELTSESPTDSKSRLHLRSMRENAARPIQGTEVQGVAGAPVFSPDSRAIAFYVGEQTRGRYTQAKGLLKRIGVDGGTAVTLSHVGLPLGMSWAGDSILIGQGAMGIIRVSSNGGEPEQIVSVKDGEIAQGPQLLPGGNAIIFTLARGTFSESGGPGYVRGGTSSESGGLGDEVWDKAEIVAQSLATGERKTLIQGGSDARYLAGGRLVYAVGATLHAVGFDPERLQVIGRPSPVVEGVARSRLGPRFRTGAAHFSVSDTGSLAYLPGPVSSTSSLRRVARIARNGAIEPLKLAPAKYDTPRVSADGTQLAVVINDGRNADVWIYDLSGSSSIRQLTSGGRNRFPVWSADGRSVAFQSDRQGDSAIFVQLADGTGQAVRLSRPEPGTTHVPSSWSSKDQLLFDIEKDSRWELWMVQVPTGKAAPFGGVPSRSQAANAMFSPDGQWFAYQSGENFSEKISVQPVPPTGVPFPVVAVGAFPRWSVDGQQLFFNLTGETFAVALTTKPRLSATQPELLFRNRYLQVVPLREGFLGLIDETPAATAAARHIQVVVNWQEELKRFVPMR